MPNQPGTWGYHNELLARKDFKTVSEVISDFSDNWTLWFRASVYGCGVSPKKGTTGGYLELRQAATGVVNLTAVPFIIYYCTTTGILMDCKAPKTA